jgi:serine/threonine protein phosphatase PrpC
VGLTDHVTVYAGTSMESPSILEVKGGSVAVFTRHSPQKETVNEDSIAVIPAPGDAIVLAVADGLGGLPAGDTASAIAVNMLANSIRNADASSLREAILDGIEIANRAILDLGTGAATTLAIVEIRGDILRSYHIGDAGVLVTGQRGRRRLQTVPHSPTGYAQEAGLINEAEALEHKERNLVSNVVGSHDLRIEIGSLLRIAPRDTVLVASDGLLDNFLSEEIVEFIRCGKLHLAADTLAIESLARMGESEPENVGGHPDDITFILYRTS